MVYSILLLFIIIQYKSIKNKEYVIVDNKNKSDNSKENKNDNDKYSFFASFKKNRNL